MPTSMQVDQPVPFLGDAMGRLLDVQKLESDEKRTFRLMAPQI